MATPCVECGRGSNWWEHRPDCSVAAAKKHETGRKISEGMKRAWVVRGARTSPEREWRAFAHRAVKKAIRLGFLPALDGSQRCVDCGGIATQYEHRDYSRVIDVEPICCGCNLRRPRAPMPQVRKFEQFKKTG